MLEPKGTPHLAVSRKGYIAVCPRGHRGLITGDRLKKVTFEEGQPTFMYVGIHLGPAMVGEPWQSRTPTLIQKVSSKTYNMLMCMLRRAQRLKNIPVS